jgi:hypothetical protein
MASQAKSYDTINVRSKTELVSRINFLADSCSKSVDRRLAAADQLMELIVRRIERIYHGKYTVDKHVWEAGELLFKLTISFQQNNLTRSECLIGVKFIKNKLFIRPWS